VTAKGSKKGGFSEQPASYNFAENPDSGSPPVVTDLPDGARVSFGDRFRFALRRIPVKQREAALGRSDKILRGYTDEKVALEVVLALARVTGIPAEWIVFGRMPSNVGSEFTMLHRLDVRASAGGGAIATTEQPVDLVAFRSEWLRRLGINPRAARTLFASGDSMEPTIGDGDLLLVDESIDRVVDHGIYVIVYQGMVLVKRVQLRRDGTLVLKSDNARYDEEVVPPAEMPEIRIAGRVRWYGKTI
jgi:phage repressor protein C with HTH and peptisase S24 domain